MFCLSKMIGIYTNLVLSLFRSIIVDFSTLLRYSIYPLYNSRLKNQLNLFDL